MSLQPYPLTPITGPFGGGSDKAGFIDGSTFGSDAFSANANEGDWLLEQTNSGTASLLRGQAILTTGGSADNEVQISRHAVNYSQETNFDMFFETRVKCEDVDDNDLFFGFYIDTADIIADVANFDGLGFLANGGDTELDFVTGSNSGTGTVTTKVHTLLDNVFFTLGIKVLGTNKVEGYINGVLVASHTLKITPSADMKHYHVINANGSGTDVLTIDYFRSSWQSSDSL